MSKKEPLVRVLLEDVAGLDRFVWGPLREAGYRYLDEVQGLSLDRLCALVTGPRAQEKLFKALGRSAELAERLGRYSFNLDGIEVTGGEINQAVGLRGTARYFLGGDATVQDLRQALQAGSVTKEQVAAYIASGRRARQQLLAKTVVDKTPKAAKEAQATLLEKAAEVVINPDELTAKIEQVVRQYEQEYDTRRWNKSDWDSVRRLAMLEIQAEMQQRALLSRGPDALFLYAPQVKALSDQTNACLTQIRQMRDELEISLRARAAKDIHAEAHEVLTDFAAQAKQLIAERASVLVHCGVRLGLCLPYFPRSLQDASVQVVCPLCGQTLEWQLVTEEMLSTYVEAGDFVPTGAPSGAFERGDEGERKIEVKEAGKEFKALTAGRLS